MKSENYILLIVNPISGNQEKEEIINLVERKAEEKNFGFQLYRTTGKNDLESINAIIEKQNPIRILVAGGDGTISLAAQCVFKKNIPMAIIPAGSANGLATNFNIPESLQAQVDIAFSGCLLDMDVLFINGKICLHIADLGINAELIKNYENSNIRGKLGYFLQSIPTLFTSNYPFEFIIKTKKGTFKKTGILLAIANANKFGTGATINPNGRINDGLFEILVFKNLDFIEIFKTMRERPEMSSDFVETIVAEEAIISTKKKIPFQIDGEFNGKVKKVEVHIESQKLSMAVPESFCQLYDYILNPQ